MSHAYDEILSQPETWEQTLATVPEQWRRLGSELSGHWADQRTHALFIGCGTSYYLAQTAAHVFQEITGLVARAIPGSEVFLSPHSTVPGNLPTVAFVFSRSGTSSEAVMATDFLRDSGKAIPTVGLTCTPGSALVQAAHYAIELPHADEQSVVMTRSFTNMLLAMRLIAADIAGDESTRSGLARVPELMSERMDDAKALGSTLGGRTELSRVIYLGLGPNYGLAEEATLKLKEMTQVECEPYNPLEFRHGAISMVRDDTLVVLLAGERERDYLPDLVANLKRYGATVGAISPYPLPGADYLLQLPGSDEGLTDAARSVLYLPPVQLLANARAEALGLNPDSPRQLGKVVRLDGH